MLDSLKTYLQFGPQYCGVEHASGDVIRASLLIKKKKEIDLGGAFEASTIEEITTYLPKKQHAYLVINNENVLSKSIESDQGDHLKLVLKAFPNIDLDEFYFEVLSQGAKHFVSLCRKPVVDDIIEEYSKHGISIIKFSLGNILGASIQKYTTYQVLVTSNSRLVFEDDMLSAIQTKEEQKITNYNINGLETDDLHLLSVVGALDTVIGQNDSYRNFDDREKELVVEYSRRRFFEVGMKSSALAFLLVLFVNFFVFNHYFQGVALLEQKLQANQSTLKEITDLNIKVANAQKMADEVLRASTSKSSFYIDAIIRCQPESILLDQLDFQPLQKKVKKDKSIEVEENVIVVFGESTSGDSFSNWLAELESFDWIRQINIVDYKDVSSIKSHFQIKIEMDAL